MKIGIMAAIPEEAISLINEMQSVSTETIGNREYYLGSLYGRDTILVFSRWGKVAASSTATTLINKYNVDHLIFTGVAGATANHLNIGDIVIGNKLYQHDMDARPIFQQHDIPLIGKTFFEADLTLVEKTQLAAKKFIAEELKKQIKPESLTTFSIKNPKVFYTGIIASGDKFVADNKVTQEITTAVPDVLAVEMEGAAVAQVCYEHDIPFIVIRIISDKADHSAAIDFQAFVAKISTDYTKGIINNLFKQYPQNV